MRKLWRLLPLAAIGVLALVVAGCGGGGSSSSSSSGVATARGQDGRHDDGHRFSGDVDSLDPGYWYYQYDYVALGQTTQRWLYSWKPNDTSADARPRPGLPQVADGGKTLTIKIKSGIKYSPPLQNRTVKAADIKYAMERCFLPQVGNGYAGVYYTDIVGAKDFQAGKAERDLRHHAPDDRRS